MKLFRLIFAGLVFFSLTVSSQIEHADAYFHSLDYHQALPLYLKAFKKKKNANNVELLVKIGDCYRFMKDYSNSATYYRLAIAKGTTDPDVFLHDGMILKSTGNYEEAEEQYKKCLSLRPGDLLAINGLLSCNEVKRWRLKPKEYDILNLKNINTAKSEFSPVLWKDRLVFVAERENDLINFSTYEFNGQPFLNVFSIPLDSNRGKKVTEFSKKLNTNYHDGPVCFSKDGNTIYYTRVKYHADRKNKEFVNRAKVYYSEMKGSTPKKELMLDFDSDEYSIAHPSLSDDGNRLFFSSDKPGGYGGFDIYMSVKTEGAWGNPINLGPDVNTLGNEEFPFYRGDSVLFFSSDGLPGFGGMDIFSAKEFSGKWILRRNEGVGINDITDDFGIFFLTDKTGYFSSDRPGGRGSDDIYEFSFVDKSTEVSGYVLTSMDTSQPAIDHKVILMDSSGNVVANTRTDKRGFFKFENLESSKNYMVLMDENDPGFSDYPRYYYADKYGKIMRITKEGEKSKFVFTYLPLRPNSLSELEAEDDITLAGNVVFNNGKLNPLGSVKLVLKDENGHFLDETVTTESGSFVFRKLPAGTNYVIEMYEEDVDLPSGGKITITNKEGKELKSIDRNEKGVFQLKILAQEKNFIEEMSADDKDLVMDLSGVALNPNKEILKGTKVFLLDELGNKIAETTTDADGSFVFKNLPSTKNYLISLDVDDPSLSQYDKLYIADKKGNIIRELHRLSDFKYHVLTFEKFTMAEMFVEDTWLVAEKVNTGKKDDKNSKNSKENTSVVKNEQTKESVVVKTKETKKDSVVVVKQKETKKDSVVVVKQKETNKDSVVVVKKKEIKNTTPQVPSTDCNSRQYTEPELTSGDSLISFETIYFSYEKYDFDEQSQKVLATVYQLLKTNKNYRIEIDAHSDSRGSDKINLWYSKIRAKNVASYFSSKGIPASRIVFRGNGELKLKNLCCDDSNCGEELHALNRRAELRVISSRK
jgi:outer membrane protein OmpA-like peptidoglycan-associated protein/tetratricopeptide (TPR) repeat protein